MSRYNSEEKWISYKLPCRSDMIFHHLQNKRVNNTEQTDQKDWDQARRVAWRQILRWLESQFALMDVGMTDIKEVFLPYCYDGKKTLFETISEDNFKQLTQ